MSNIDQPKVWGVYLCYNNNVECNKGYNVLLNYIKCWNICIYTQADSIGSNDIAVDYNLLQDFFLELVPRKQ